MRGLRVAARLGFQFSSETSTAIRDLSPSIIDIDKVYLPESDVQTYMFSRVFSLYVDDLIYSADKVGYGNEIYAILWGGRVFD